MDQVTIPVMVSHMQSTVKMRSDLSMLDVPYTAYINTCPVCHYSGTHQDFDHSVSPAVKTYVVKHFKPFLAGKKLDPVSSMEVALQLYQWEQRSPYDIAWLAMIGSYLFYNPNQNPPYMWLSQSSTFTLSAMEPLLNKRRYFQAIAAHAFEAAWKQKIIPQGQESVAAYLIGELYRRLGFFDTAIAWFKVAKHQKNISSGYQELIESMAKLAVEGKSDEAAFYSDYSSQTIF